MAGTVWRHAVLLADALLRVGFQDEPCGLERAARDLVGIGLRLDHARGLLQEGHVHHLGGNAASGLPHVELAYTMHPEVRTLMRSVSHKHQWNYSLIRMHAERVHSVFVRWPHSRLNHGFAQPDSVIPAHLCSDEVLAHARAYICCTHRLLEDTRVAAGTQAHKFTHTCTRRRTSCVRHTRTRSELLHAGSRGVQMPLLDTKWASVVRRVL